MNRIISNRPHGRSRTLDEPGNGMQEEAIAEEAIKINADDADKIVIALRMFISVKGGQGLAANERPVEFIAVPHGATLDLETKAHRPERDIVALYLKPGLELNGPTSIAVRETHDGQTTIWSNFTLWCDLYQKTNSLRPPRAELVSLLARKSRSGTGLSTG